MAKRSLALIVLALLVSTSSGCYCLRDWLHGGSMGCFGGGCGGCGHCGVGVSSCGDCGNDSCGGGCGMESDCDDCNRPVTRSRCGGGCGGGCGIFDDFFGWGCGQMYWGDLCAVPPQRCQPCDQHGNWVGGTPTYHKGMRTYPGNSYGPEMPMEYGGEVMEYEMSKAPAKHVPTPAKTASRPPRRAY